MINDRVEEDVKIKNPDMSEQDKEEIIEQTIESELQSLYNNVVKKAETLIRLQVPAALIARD